MATRTWNLSGGGAWGTASNWLENAVPVAGDDAIVNKSLSSDQTITTGNLATFPTTLTVSNQGGTGRWLLGAGGNTFALTQNLTLTISARGSGTYDFTSLGQFTGAYAITKDGAGIWSIATSASSTAGITVKSGGIAAGWAVYSAGTYINFGDGVNAPTTPLSYRLGSGTTQTITTPWRIRDDVTLDNASGAVGYTHNADFVIAPRLASVPPVISTVYAITLAGVVSGTAGFVKAGSAALTLSNTGNTISGPVSATAGTLSFSSTVLARASLKPDAGTLAWTSGTTVGALTGSGALALSTALTVGSANSPAAETYSGVLSGASLLTKAGSSFTQTLSGASTHTGGFTINAGTLKVTTGGATTGALGGTSGAITIASAGVLEFAGSSATQTFTKTTSAVTVDGGKLLNSANTNTFEFASITMTSNPMQLESTSGTLILSTSGDISGATSGITKTGTETVRIAAPNATFGGKVTISAGTLEVTKLGNTGLNSSIGRGSSVSIIDLNKDATLKHVGTTADSTNRVLNFTGAAGTRTLASSDSAAGAINYAATPTFAVAGAHTIALTGTSTNSNNRLSGTIADSGSAPNLTTVAKSGSGTWALAGTLNFTGGLAISEGGLTFGSAAKTINAPITISGGTLANGASLVTASAGITMTGGRLTAVLTGASTTLTINTGSAATVQPATTTSSNAHTGATTISAGGVVRAVTEDATVVSTAGNGRVLGNGTVTVNGTLRTATSSTSKQKGQLRYNNLTLNSGARLEIGAA